MYIALTPELDDFVQKAVGSGRYPSATEVVCAGLRLLVDHERKRDACREALRTWIKDAIEDPRPHIEEEDVVARVEARLAAKLTSLE
jgi:antitoxin ParD1/3/4